MFALSNFYSGTIRDVSHKSAQMKEICEKLNKAGYCYPWKPTQTSGRLLWIWTPKGREMVKGLLEIVGTGPESDYAELAVDGRFAICEVCARHLYRKRAGQRKGKRALCENCAKSHSLD